MTHATSHRVRRKRRWLPFGRGNTWRTYYGNGWSIHFFKWGIQTRRRREEKLWHSCRLAVFSRHPKRAGMRLIDYSSRDQQTAQGKPLRPCWRLWVAVNVGRTPSALYEENAQ